LSKSVIPVRPEVSKDERAHRPWRLGALSCRIEGTERFAGTRPGGRVTFLLRGKKVTKEARPAASALRATRSLRRQAGRACKLAFGSNSKPGNPSQSPQAPARQRGTTGRFVAAQEAALQTSIDGASRPSVARMQARRAVIRERT
jgi:hypothetical protein